MRNLFPILLAVLDPSESFENELPGREVGAWVIGVGILSIDILISCPRSSRIDDTNLYGFETAYFAKTEKQSYLCMFQPEDLRVLIKLNEMIYVLQPGDSYSSAR